MGHVQMIARLSWIAPPLPRQVGSARSHPVQSNSFDMSGAGINPLDFRFVFAYRSHPRLEVFMRIKAIFRANPGRGRGLPLFLARVLADRLREHSRSIEEVGSLDVGDFACRFLVVDDIWIPLGESLLIGKFSPVWNTTLDGFGNHDPGKGRYKQQRSCWDVVHPGRKWAEKCARNERSFDDLASVVREKIEHAYGSETEPEEDE